MKKILIISIFIILCGCSNKNSNVTTIIEENTNSNICINYPTTNIEQLDNIIKEYILVIHNNFKENNTSTINNKSELNIDYSYYEINNYITITISSYINDTINIKNNIMTYLFDSKNNKLLNLNDVINNNMNYDLFSFDENYLYIYTNINNNIHTTKYNLAELDLKIDIIGNKTKSVINELKDNNKILDPNQKFIALTFDDGPSIYTQKIIELLKEHDINATFFILGNKVDIYKDVLTKSILYGNEIGNHSYNHKWLIKLDEEEIKDQIDKTQEIIQNNLGYTPKIFRPTYGSINDKLKNTIDLDIVLWNVDTMDWKYKNLNTIISKATKNLKDGNIILMHDTYKRTYEALKKIIPIIKNEGYTFVTISEMQEIKKIRQYEK